VVEHAVIRVGVMVSPRSTHPTVGALRSNHERTIFAATIISQVG